MSTCRNSTISQSPIRIKIPTKPLYAKCGMKIMQCNDDCLVSCDFRSSGQNHVLPHQIWRVSKHYIYLQKVIHVHRTTVCIGSESIRTAVPFTYTPNFQQDWKCLVRSASNRERGHGPAKWPTACYRSQRIHTVLLSTINRHQWKIFTSRLLFVDRRCHEIELRPVIWYLLSADL